MVRRVSFWIAALLLFLPAFLSSLAVADDDKLKKEELQQLLAPVALYPDDLLTNVLMASTYPLDVVQAARWRSENSKLKGDALTKALESKDWDPSVKALTQFPDVLKSMSDKLDWTQKLGDAFLAQQDDVMDAIQFLRAKADEAGNLKSNDKQKVSKESGGGGGTIYVIEPTQSETVYVPYYQPTVVYGAWSYPDYPPYTWPYVDDYVDGWYWGTGIAIAGGIWAWNRFDWRNHDIDIDVDRWNNINVDRGKINSGKWQHRPDHRGPVPYKNKEVRDKFNKGERAREGSKDFRGFDKSPAERAKVKEKLGESGGAKIKDKVGDAGGGKIKDKVGDAGGGKVKDKVGKAGSGKIKDKAGSKSPKGSRDVSRPKTSAKSKKPSPGAFDVKRGADVKRQASRGNASRAAMSRAPRGGSGISRGGGGGRGGGGRGGGRRSDIRLKEDIVPLLRLDNGLELYRFRYKGGDHTAYVGVMAQEVWKFMPAAVSFDSQGYLMVDYDRLGVKFMTWKEWKTRRGEAPSVLP